MPAKKVTTVTLLRGALYSLRHPDNTPANPKESLRFERGKPVVIKDPKIIRVLEELYAQTVDGDGEWYEKPIFRVDRNVAEPADDGVSGKPQRLSSHRRVRRHRTG